MMNTNNLAYCSRTKIHHDDSNFANPAGYLMEYKTRGNSQVLLHNCVSLLTGSEHHTHAKFRKELPANPSQTPRKTLVSWLGLDFGYSFSSNGEYSRAQRQMVRKKQALLCIFATPIDAVFLLENVWHFSLVSEKNHGYLGSHPWAWALEQRLMFLNAWIVTDKEKQKLEFHWTGRDNFHWIRSCLR